MPEHTDGAILARLVVRDLQIGQILEPSCRVPYTCSHTEPNVSAASTCGSALSNSDAVELGN